MDNATLITLIINGIATPLFTLITLWARDSMKKGDRTMQREDGFIANMEKRITELEKEVRTLRSSLDAKTGEYLKLFQDYVSLKAKYDALLIDHQQLKENHFHTAEELERVKQEMKCL